MDLIFSAALAAGRRLRRETILGRHPSSVSSAAVELAFQVLDRDSQVVVLGAGEAAEGVLRSLHQLGVSRVTLMNRHSEKAGVLASAWGARTGAWNQLDETLAAADLLFVATGSRTPVITADQLSRVVAARITSNLVVLDLSIPRNVEPAARGIDGIQLLDLDDLQRRCCPATGTASDLVEAEAIIEDELVRLGSSLRGRVAAPRLAELHRLSQLMAEQESTWALSQLESLSESEREVVRQMAERLVRRVLYPVSRSIREEVDSEA
jgi:glutamyl-tRNA reductase